MMQRKETCPSLEGTKPINIRRNRYKDVLPCTLNNEETIEH